MIKSRQQIGILVAALLALSPFICRPASASLSLVSGRQYALCRALEQNFSLISSPNDAGYEWPVSPGIKELRKPRWTALDPTKNRDLIKRIMIRSTRGSFKGDEQRERAWWDSVLPYIEKELAEGSLRLEETKIDFDHDGRSETMVRLGRPAYLPPAMEKPTADTPRILGWINDVTETKTNGLIESFAYWVGSRLFSDVVLFQGRMHFLGWSTFQKVEAYELSLAGFSVPNPSWPGIAIIPVCSFRYQG